MVHRAIDTFGYVTASFKYTGFVFMRIVQWGGYRSLGRQKVFPFVVEIDQCGDIGLPGFVFQIVEILIGDFRRKILVGQSGKAVSEFVNENMLCPLIISCPHGVEVVHAAPSVGVGVDQQEYSIAGNIPDCVADGFHIRCCQVTVYAERIIS